MSLSCILSRRVGRKRRFGDSGRYGSRTSLVSANLLVGALGLVALGDNGRHVAAGLAVAVGCGHGRHDGQRSRRNRRDAYAV